MSIKRRRKGKGKSNLTKAIAYGGGIAVCVGGLANAVMQNIGKAVPDEYGCYAEMPVSQHVHVLIDISEPRFSDEQQRSLFHYTEQLYDDLDFGNKISVYTTGNNEATSVSKESFHICGQPADKEELDVINAVEASDAYLLKQKERLYQKQFLPWLEGILAKDLAVHKKASSSPILEMIADLSHLPSMKAGGKLVVISDLLQNSRSVKPFCHVRMAMPSFATFSQREVYKTFLKPQSLVEVEILMLERQSYGQYCNGIQELYQWWVDYFKANGVKAPNFIRIRTGG